MLGVPSLQDNQNLANNNLLKLTSRGSYMFMHPLIPDQLKLLTSLIPSVCRLHCNAIVFSNAAFLVMK